MSNKNNLYRVSHTKQKKDKNTKIEYFRIELKTKDRPNFYLAFLNKADSEKIEKKINEQLQLLSKMPLSSEFYKNKINDDHKIGWSIRGI